MRYPGSAIKNINCGRARMRAMIKVTQIAETTLMAAVVPPS
jgi:hypothetical protein